MASSASEAQTTAVSASMLKANMPVRSAPMGTITTMAWRRISRAGLAASCSPAPRSCLSASRLICT